MAALSQELMSFVSRYQSLQSRRVSSDELIMDLLLYCENVERLLREKNAELVQQLNEAQKSKRQLQQLLIDAAEANVSLKNRNPYVLILIDGDGLIFLEELIRQGIEGGKKAAYALRAEVAGHCGKLADDVEVVAKVCANLTGLTRAMKRHGLLERESEFKDFTLGFTQARASFDFVDVGHGKERADSKIQEATRWNLRNYNCKHILLGISHDSGYAPFLDEILKDDESRSRITVVEGAPTVRELRNTGVKIIQLNSLFRKEKLLDKMVVEGKSVVRRPTSPFGHGSAPATPLLPGSTANPEPVSGSTMSSSSWADVTALAGASASASPSAPHIVIPLGSTNGTASATATAPGQRCAQESSGPETAAWNPGPRGLDEPVTANPAAVDAIKKRKDRLCNNHYLRGYCSKGNDCSFDHTYKASEEDLQALSVLARLNPCGKGQECEIDSCFYGHHCPSVKDGICAHPYCKFRVEDHPPGTIFKNRNIRDN